MKNIRALACIIFFIGILCSCIQQEQKTTETEPIKSGWQSVYKHDKNGNPLEGSIDSLIAGIRNGYDVRVGWGWEKNTGDSILRLEHMATPIFLTVIQEKDVSAIINAHPLLESYIDIENQKFGEGGHIWQCVLTTKGTFNAQVHDRSTGVLLKDWPQNHKMTWFLDYPDDKLINNKPLYD